MWLDLPLDHLLGAAGPLAPRGRAREDEEAVFDRRQRVAQLVRERGEEVVLAAVGFLQGLGEGAVAFLAGAQGRLGELGVVDVGRGAVPADDPAGLVAHGQRAGENRGTRPWGGT